jgi:hypothetical protein
MNEIATRIVYADRFFLLAFLGMSDSFSVCFSNFIYHPLSAKRLVPKINMQNP